MSAVRRWLSRDYMSAPWPVAVLADIDKRECSTKDRASQNSIISSSEIGPFKEPASSIRAVRKRSC